MQADDCNCDWSDSYCGTRSPEELIAGVYYNDVDPDTGANLKKLCYRFPNVHTGHNLVGITYYMKKAGHVVTLVPMAT